ncbi:MAG: hypothetical protein COZ07_08065 [Candidatus Infernicultor aquiphilus]|uniref:Glycosyltransferase family 1 protein n=1 Tax=Candidatus Infernicultor aquiphilus TaxID=1805029 RepID=A0A2M7PMZ8_9BACT|nr:MAG: hypothetical protein COZ85_01585 [Candidatus Moranbacteria bacterium CG_4_8_14_3_um_filter_34_16]PIY31781.1 MAG: hypothetical protein COZ07_08065 [Candidatus Atribacteria bacterium CG_4_10_14_3_um_filter_34_13]
MKIAMITTWDRQCGIAEYAKSLVSSLEKLGVDIQVFDKDNIEWRGLERCNIIHFQNQGSFWSGEWLMNVLKMLKTQNKRTIVTFHDSAVWEGFDFKNIDIAIAHREDIFKNMLLPKETKKITFPMGIPEIPVKICSFGIGRNDNIAVKRICDELGFGYNIPSKWLPTKKLIEFIKSHDGVVLWYNEVGIVGSSAAARLAIACRRPLFLSNVSWFDDLDSIKTKNLYKARDLNCLKLFMESFYKNYLTIEEGFNNLAKKHKELYGRLY